MKPKIKWLLQQRATLHFGTTVPFKMPIVEMNTLPRFVPEHQDEIFEPGETVTVLDIRTLISRIAHFLHSNYEFDSSPLGFLRNQFIDFEWHWLLMDQGSMSDRLETYEELNTSAHYSWSTHYGEATVFAIPKPDYLPDDKALHVEHIFNNPRYTEDLEHCRRWKRELRKKRGLFLIEKRTDPVFM